MNADELARLLAAGDTHGLVMAAVRLHAGAKFGEEWDGGLVCISLGVGQEPEQLVIPRRPRPVSPSSSPVAPTGTAS